MRRITHYFTGHFTGWSAFLVIGLFTISITPVYAIAPLTPITTQKTAVATNLGLDGGQANDIALDVNSEAAYSAHFAPNGIFSSQDNGETWQSLPSTANYGSGKAVEVDQTTGDAYAMIGDSVIKTTDQGTTWNDMSGNFSEPVILGEVMVYTRDRLIVATGDGSVMISNDAGASFTKATVLSNSRITWLAGATNSDTYYAVVQIDGSSEKLYKSVDGGVNWTDMDVHTKGVDADGRLYEVSVDPLDDSYLVMIATVPNNPAYQTTNGGNSWTKITDSGSNVLGTHATFDSTGRLYVGSNYSDNPTAGTPTWSVFSTITPLSSIYSDMFAVDPSDPDILFTNSAMGIAKSIDQGATWTDEIDGITAVKTYDISQAKDKDIVWIGANGGLAKTTNFTDASPTWEYPVLPAPGLNNIQAVWVNPDDGNMVVAGLSSFISKTTDGGDTWVQSTAPAFSGRVQDIVQSNVDPNTLYAIYWNDDLAATDVGGVFMSTDTGDTWTDLALPNNLPAVSLAVDANDIVYVGIGGDDTSTGIYTYDGATWTHIAGDFSGDKINSIVVNPSHPKVIYVTTETSDTSSGLYISKDSGTTWKKNSHGLKKVNQLGTLILQETTKPYTLYVAGQADTTLNGVIYKSSNAGVTWNLYYTGLKQETFYALLFDGLVVGNDRGLYDLKSRANVKIKVNSNTTNDVVRVTLKDASTKKKLRNRLVTVYARDSKNDSWNKMTKAKTNKKGKITLSLDLAKNTQLKAVWTPKTSDKEEYTKARSRIVKVKQ